MARSAQGAIELAVAMCHRSAPAQEARRAPYVVVPYQEIGQYGGYAYVGRDRTGHWGGAHLLIGIESLNRIAGDLSTQSPNVATDYELSADAKVFTMARRGAGCSARPGGGEPHCGARGAGRLDGATETALRGFFKDTHYPRGTAVSKRPSQMDSESELRKSARLCDREQMPGRVARNE